MKLRVCKRCAERQRSVSPSFVEGVRILEELAMPDKTDVVFYRCEEFYFPQSYRDCLDRMCESGGVNITVLRVAREYINWLETKLNNLSEVQS